LAYHQHGEDSTAIPSTLVTVQPSPTGVDGAEALTAQHALGDGQQCSCALERRPSVEVAGAVAWVPLLNGEPLSVNRPRELAGGFTASLQIEQEAPERRPPHPEGKTCGECQLFDHYRGRAMLAEKDMKFQNGSISLLSEVVKLVTDAACAPPTSPQTIGWCPAQGGLTDKRSPGCADAFHAIPESWRASER
jgi:hypothetical protein